MNNRPFIFVAFVLFAILSSCSDYKEVSDSKFIGTWELTGRSMFDGMKIKIEKKSNNSFTGKIVELNDNKFVKMFADSNDVWVSDIKRTSNFQFKITEKRIGRQLFALYELGTSDTYKVEFIDDDSFGLAEGSTDPLKSDVIYKRIKDKHLETQK